MWRARPPRARLTSGTTAFLVALGKHAPDNQSSKEYSDAIAIARNLRGKHVRYPVYDGPLILDMYIVPEKGGDFIRVA